LVTQREHHLVHLMVKHLVKVMVDHLAHQMG
jgi:hypothetical protein